MQTMEFQQMQVKKSFDKKARAREFSVGDIVLKWDVLKNRSGHHNKFDHMWEYNAYQLAMMEGDVLPIPVNGIHLKPYFEV